MKLIRKIIFLLLDLHNFHANYVTVFRNIISFYFSLWTFFETYYSRKLVADRGTFQAQSPEGRGGTRLVLEHLGTTVGGRRYTPRTENFFLRDQWMRVFANWILHLFYWKFCKNNLESLYSLWKIPWTG